MCWSRPNKNIREDDMISRKAAAALALGLAAGTLAAGSAQAQGSLVMYCAVNEEWCRATVNAFERETGIKISMTRKSSGEVYAQVKAEAQNPRADIWWGGTGDPHMQAAEEGLTVEYKSPKMSELQDWSVRQWEQSKGRAIGIYSGASATTPSSSRAKASRSPNAGPTSSTRSSRTRCRSRTRIRRARPTRSSPPRWCRSWARTKDSNTSRRCTR